MHHILLRPYKAVLCYICALGHKQAHVCSLVFGLVSGNSEESGFTDTAFLPMGLQFPSAPSILPLTLPYWSPTSVQWLAVNICICLSQLLVEPLRGQPCQSSVYTHNIASVLCQDLVGCACIGWIPSLARHWVAFLSVAALFCPCVYFRQEQF